MASACLLLASSGVIFDLSASAQSIRRDARASRKNVKDNSVEPAAVPALVSASLVQVIDTSLWNPASPDPSGIAYIPSIDRLIVVDSEVDEVTGAGQNTTNLWEITRQGVVTDFGATLVWGGVSTPEPTGADYDAKTDTLFVSTDDGGDRIYVVQRGVDGRFGTADDLVRMILTEFLFGATDTEDPAFDPASGDLFFLDGTADLVYRVNSVNGVFGDGDDTATSFPIGNGVTDSEGLVINQARDTVMVGERAGTRRILEFTKDGTLVQIITTTGIFPPAPPSSFISGLTTAPASNGSGAWSYWIVDRSVDNDTAPTENDGQIYEISIPWGENLAPVVDSVAINEQLPKTNDVLSATVTSHDENGDAVTYEYQWLKNGVPIAGETGSTLDLSVAGNGDKGDEISLRVRPSDDTVNGTYRTSFSVRIVNSAPVLNLSDRKNRNEDVVDVSVAAIDPDGDALTYSATGLPDGLSIDVNTGQVTGQIPAGTHVDSPFNVQVTASDGVAAPAPPITLVQAVTPNVSTTAALTVTFPNAPTEGNLLVALGRIGSGRYPTMAAGWRFLILTNSNPRAVAFYKIAGPGESSSVTLNAVGDVATTMALGIFEYSGVLPVETKALDAWISQGPIAGTNTASTGSVFTTEPNELLLAGLQTGGTREMNDAWTNGFSRVSSLAVGTHGSAYAHRIGAVPGGYSTSLTWPGNPTTAATTLMAFKQAPAADVASTIDTFVWTVNVLGPTAAPVSVSGRVTTGTGLGVYNAIIRAQGQDGQIWAARTNSFGFYQFPELPSGATYVFTVSSKRYTFPPQVVSVEDHLKGLDFVAD